jgi:hypothetical protein
MEPKEIIPNENIERLFKTFESVSNSLTDFMTALKVAVNAGVLPIQAGQEIQVELLHVGADLFKVGLVIDNNIVDK